ncbi:hypothetical protein RRF57_009454 [Xylaria bambusicola]|uniref:Uncharacterized protein n=1 Tax=Xylaria bambusicola TaxID=326684 RepID=A0AAN7Z1M8_9PEZI
MESSPILFDVFSDVSLGIRWAKRLSPRVVPGRFSPIVEPGSAKFPKLPNPDSPPDGVVCHGEGAPYAVVLVAVLARVRPPNGMDLVAVSLAPRSSSGSSHIDGSLASVFFRSNQSEPLSREGRFVEMGEFKPPPTENGLVSPVSRRRVPGRDVFKAEGKLKLLEVPWEREVFRPFMPPPGWTPSLFWAAGGFMVELTSKKA